MSSVMSSYCTTSSCIDYFLTIPYNGFKLAYRRYGASDAPAVVLIMGLGMSSAAWPTSLIAHLVREGFQVITPDNRDCGESSRCTDMKADGRDVASAVAQALLRRKGTSAYALEDMALDVERLLNHLSIRRAHIVGISMGGMIAQVAAVQSPNRVASLTSIASASGNPRTGFGRLNAVWTLLRKPDNLNTEEGLRDYFARVFTTLSGPAYKPSGEELACTTILTERRGSCWPFWRAGTGPGSSGAWRRPR